MPRTANKNMPLLAWNTLYTDDEWNGIQPATVRFNAWLSEFNRFSFQGKNGTFTARSEERRNGKFWYAFKTVSGKTRKVYIGKSENVTSERLEEVARLLSLPA